MKKGEIIRKIIVDPAVRANFKTIKCRFLYVLSFAHIECKEDFHKLEGLTWPNGDGILISKSKHIIEKSFPSAIAEAIPNTSYYVEVGHAKTELKRLTERVLKTLGYPPGLRNEVRDFLEPSTAEEMKWRFPKLIEE